MREILETKDSFTANEQKVSSNLVLAGRKALAQPIAGSNGIIARTNITAGMATIQIKAKALEYRRGTDRRQRWHGDRDVQAIQTDHGSGSR